MEYNVIFIIAPALPRNCGILFPTQLVSLSLLSVCLSVSLSLSLCEIGTAYKCLRWRKYIKNVSEMLFFIGLNVAFNNF